MKIVEEGGVEALLMLLQSSQNSTILRVASGAIANLAMNGEHFLLPVQVLYDNAVHKPVKLTNEKQSLFILIVVPLWLCHFFTMLVCLSVGSVSCSRRFLVPWLFPAVKLLNLEWKRCDLFIYMFSLVY